MSRLQTAVFAVISIVLVCGCAIVSRGTPTAIEPTVGAMVTDTPSSVAGPTMTLDMEFIAADVSHTLIPFQYLQGLSDAGITFFGAEKL